MHDVHSLVQYQSVVIFTIYTFGIKVKLISYPSDSQALVCLNNGASTSL